MTESNSVMLPKNVRPSKYTLMLQPDLETFTFSGSVAIDIEVLQPAESIVLNAAELAVTSCRVESSGGEASPSVVALDEKAETASFAFDSALPAGPARLEIEFTGELNDRLRGFYRSRYTDVHGEERHLATTQFEATDARRAFPCWDEPSMKATFQVTLVVPAELEAVSNTMIAEESAMDGGLRRVRFEETPVMSTYLLAFIVGDIKCVERTAEGGTLVRVWATSGKENLGEFAAETSVKLLSFFNDYFGVPYPLPKLDHIAIPDFAAGAMENWGAVTYREVVLLVDPKRTSVQVRQRIAAIISHEMAHMWFGDLVTMAWWNDLWLNESFASWIGDKAVDWLFPDWEMWTQFVSGDTNIALSLDGLRSSHPIEQEVKDPAEIGQLFDAISYSKGGSILRMLEHFLGEETFREGLRSYISRHQYGNAVTRDLWNALGEASGQPVADIMDTWVQQTGYPVLDVEADFGEDGIEVHASQTRFVYEHLVDPDAAEDTTWHVPVTVAAQGGGAASTLMEGPQADIRLTGDPARGWVKVNPDQVGFYRANYGGDGWERLRPAIEGMKVSAIDRLGLQNDAFALARAAYLPVTQFLSLARSYVNETNAIVWEDISSNFGKLDLLVADEPFYSRFAEMMRGIYGPAGERVGWEAHQGERELDALMRSTILGQLGKYDDEATLDTARSLFKGYNEDPASVHPDIRGIVFNLAARQGDESTYQAIWDLYDRTSMEEEKMRLLIALGSFRNADLLSETLDQSLSDRVRYHDTIQVVSGVAANRLGRDMAWDFVKDNWDEFSRRYSDGLFALSRLVGITARFTTKQRLDDVEGFFDEHPTPAADRAISQSLETVRLNIAWLGHNRADLAAYFAE